MDMIKLQVVVFLLSVSEVISQCPPSSGKTLDVYNNNCIGFIGIYLRHNGSCYIGGGRIERAVGQEKWRAKRAAILATPTFPTRIWACTLPTHTL